MFSLTEVGGKILWFSYFRRYISHRRQCEHCLEGNALEEPLNGVIYGKPP